MTRFTDMTVAEVAAWLRSRKGILSAQDLAQLKEDSRKGVRQLVARFELQKARELSERQRLKRMWLLEEKAWSNGYQLVAGIDEAGCGPLAGPVVAAAVVFPQAKTTLWGLDDSKQLTAGKRELLYQMILENAVAVGVGIIHNQEIDRLNILEATKRAMTQAVANLPVLPDLALVDGNQARLPSLDIPCQTIVDGDGCSCSIAAASIVAKVTRDRLMDELDVLYPGYGFAQHKGYPSRQHYEALRQLGPSPIHRRTFLRKFYGDE